MNVYGFVGLPGSGKSEAAAVAGELDIPVVTMGDIIREECRERGLDPATQHGRVATQLREEDGDDAIAKRSLPHIEEALADNKTVVVDGIRSAVEVERFEETYGDAFTLVEIEAPFQTRAERLTLRGRDATDKEGGETLEDRDSRELSFGMGKAMERANRTVENDGSLAAFRTKIREILEEN